MNADAHPASPVSERSYQGIRNTAQSGRHRNEIAQRHHSGSRLSQSLPADRDQVETVTSVLSVPAQTPRPAASGRSVIFDDYSVAPWPETPPGADPLPGQLDRWLASRGAELVAVRRHLHAHPELSGQEFETAAMIARQLTLAGLLLLRFPPPPRSTLLPYTTLPRAARRASLPARAGRHARPALRPAPGR